MILEYVERAMAKAEYDRLEDGSYAGRIPTCTGVVAFAKSLAECQRTLRSVLDEWILLGLKKGDRLPPMDDIDLDAVAVERVASL